MQSFAFLWFQLQMTKQYLREKTFGPEQPPPNSTNLDTPIGAGTPRSYPSSKYCRWRLQWNAALAIP
jgi:hypothetical protein